ncbi:MAG: alpha/beta fold hydrolase [Sphingomicrobium sp.]
MRILALLLCGLAATTLNWDGASAAQPKSAASSFVPQRFSVVVQGQGPDVILIPGLSSTRDVWTATAAELRKTNRVHLVQVRGFGEPAGPNATGPVLQPVVDELAAYIRANGLKNPAVIGHSMGGLAALMLGVQAPDLPGKLMIVDAFPFIGPVFGAPDLATITPRAEQMRAAMLANAPKVAPAIAAADCKPSAKPPAQLAGSMTNSVLGQCMMKHGAMTSDMRVVAQAMYDDMTTDVRPRLKDIKAPVTIVYPQDDRLVTEADATQIYTSAYVGTPKATFVRVPGSYHFVMLDQPERFAQAVKAFVAD